jgi:alpha-tubulin suppressor-like RCC1 family protein/pimeloyl-ACP methyl ester carboxylesterase
MGSPAVTISPAVQTLEAIGDSLRMTAVVRDRAGAVVVGASVAWTSSRPDILSVDGGGLVRALAKGDGTIRAEALGASATASITVSGTAIVTTVGPAGGAVAHPAGASLVIPAGAVASAVVVRIETIPSEEPVAERASESFRFSVTGTASTAFARRTSAGPSADVPAYATLVLPLTRPVAAAGELLARVRVSNESLPRYAADAALGTASTLQFSVPLEAAFYPLEAVALLLGAADGCESKYELREARADDAAWDSTTPPVIFIHGWQPALGSCLMWQSFNPEAFGGAIFTALSSRGLQTRTNYWRYTYPSFNSVDAAASDLASELQQKFGGRTDVIIVAHSMGGLVARAAVELHGAGTQVRRVITLGTPHVGTPLAVPAAWLNLTPFLSFGSQGTKDLQPESSNGFIRRLNAASLPARRPTYHTIAGDLQGGSCTSSPVFCGMFEAGDRILRLLGPGSDGVVPTPSAAWTATDPDGRYGEVAMGLNHDAVTSDAALLQRVAALVEEAVSSLVPPDSGQTLSVSSRGSHSCALRASGEAFCWGYNVRGQLGDGSTGSSGTPVRVTGGHQFREISVGGYHTCAIKATGAAYCWGYNQYGQLGTGGTEDAGIPVPVAGGYSFVQISAGELHTCGLTADGTALCWGYNESGQLGTGIVDGSSQGPIPHPRAERVAGAIAFSRVEAGYTQTCAIASGGATYCWGSTANGQLGDGRGLETPSRPAPTQVTGGHGFVAVSAGAGFTCAVTAANDAFCWGLNADGQLGVGTSDADVHSVPQRVPGSFRVVSAGIGTTCAVGTDAKGYCWGSYGRGTLGVSQAPELCNNSGCSTRPIRTALAASSRWVSASRHPGGAHVCAVSTGDEVYCWGSGIRGQLGNGGFNDSSAPVRVTLP